MRDLVVKLLAAEGWLQHFERVDDLSQDDRWADLSVSSNLRTWRSLLIVPSERLRQADLPGLLWSSRDAPIETKWDHI
jgi:hypothetical protein